ncbi:hypothetical protein FQR65_LT12393 [Abscondita terminalis]|nr:hypothetical protein FQR65_LT12393 [Abscondita terminalis]
MRLVLTCLMLVVSSRAKITIPGEKIDKKTLTNVGIKTIDWQQENERKNEIDASTYVKPSYQMRHDLQQIIAAEQQNLEGFGQSSNLVESEAIPEGFYGCPEKETGQFPSALSCNQFWNCWKGRGVLQNCAPGTLFNPYTFECDYASKVKCLSRTKSEAYTQESLASSHLKTGCPTGFSGVVPHHNDCSKFINCDHGKENVMDCGPGTLFNLKINACDHPYNTECASWSNEFTPNDDQVQEGSSVDKTKPIQCPLDAVGLYPHPWDCAKFLNCANGQTFIQDCGPGTHFNPETLVCDFPHNVKCKSEDYGTGNIDVRTQPLDLTCPLHAEGVYPHPNFCSKYVNCYRGRTEIKECPRGLMYDATGNGCDTAFKVDCTRRNLKSIWDYSTSQTQWNDQQQGWNEGETSWNQQGQTPSFESQTSTQQGSSQSQNHNTRINWNQNSESDWNQRNDQSNLNQASNHGLNQHQSNLNLNQGWNQHQGNQWNQNQGSGTSENQGWTSQSNLNQAQGTGSKWNQNQGSESQNWNSQYGQSNINQGWNQPHQNQHNGNKWNQHQGSGITGHQGWNQQQENKFTGSGVTQNQGQQPKNQSNLNQHQGNQGWTSQSNFNQKWNQSQQNQNTGSKLNQNQESSTLGTQSWNSPNGQSNVNQVWNQQQQNQNPGNQGWTLQNQGWNQQQQYQQTGGKFNQNQGSGTTGSQGWNSLHGQSNVNQGWNQQQQNQNTENQDWTLQNQGWNQLHQNQQAGGKLNQNQGGGTTGNQGWNSLYGQSNVSQGWNQQQHNQNPENHGWISQNQGWTLQNQGWYQPQQNQHTGSKLNQTGGSGRGNQGWNLPYGQSNVSQGWNQQQENQNPENHGWISQNQGWYQPQQNQQTGSKLNQTGGNGSGNQGWNSPYGQSNANQQQQNQHPENQGWTSQSNQGWNRPQQTGNNWNKNQESGTLGNQDWLSQQGQSNLNKGFNQQQEVQNTGNQDWNQQGQNTWNQALENKVPKNQPINSWSQQNQNTGASGSSTSKQNVKGVNFENRFGNQKPTVWNEQNQNIDQNWSESQVVEQNVESAKGQKLIQKNRCSLRDFRCTSNVCIPRSMHCDGVKDCPDGLDERNCEKILNEFVENKNHILAVREKEKFFNVTVLTCAKACLESKSFQCRSFSFRRDDGACFLSDANVGATGSLILSYPYDYYELSALTMNCTNLHECPNHKCISNKQICDGVNDCGDRSDEKGCSAQAFGYQIKLAGGEEPHEGRIEINAFGQTGYVCDDKFGLRNGDVVCKEMGYPLGALEVKSNSFFAKDVKDKDVLYLMDDVTCLGNETSIRDCDFNGWGVSNCESQEVVGVICKTPQETCPKDHWKCDTVPECLPLVFVCDGVYDCTDESDESAQHCDAPTELRLVGGLNKLEGRLEVRHYGIWGTVCDDDFNDDAAKVVCKYFGYPGKATAKKNGGFGPGTGPIWLDQVFCQGNETALDQCLHWNWGEHNCEHSEDVGIVCTDNQAPIVESERKARVESLPESAFVEQCGLRKDAMFLKDDDDVHFRVVAGAIAEKGDYPWQASLRIRNQGQMTHWCGAVVITKKFILTAAHCLQGFSKGAYIVVAGDYNTDEDEGTEQEAYIEEFYIHEHFRRGQKMNNDIALIKLKGAGFTFTKDVQPICMPSTDILYEPGLNCTISGFGSIQSGKSSYSHDMRAVYIPLIAQDVCKMPHVYGNTITDGMVCAGSLDEGADACEGDSGGPLACLHDGYYTLYGLTSWGHHCGHANKPGVYVRVAHYRKWIDDMILKHV